MSGRTRVARVARKTGCQVAQWGVNLLLPSYGRMGRILPRRTHHVVAGPLVDLSRFHLEPGPQVWRQATEEITAAITSLLAGIRGITATAGQPVPSARDGHTDGVA
ncbi:hypothetical protein GCM10010330_76670 [Streptomyces tendae]|uniref:hypothetical protein n=1 Tax=Streptomyces tendae TaxID=1932 RepID=UPI0016772A92|nr:hypothetical protein [Streptomyces tendae]GHB11307.1 hypothetical protein GCM10010330_76670 [Streptomyces tendae]